MDSSSAIEPVVLTKEKKTILNEKISLILSRWNVVQDAVENGCGCRDSQTKAKSTVFSLFDSFIQSKDPLDFGGLAYILEEVLDELNTVADDESFDKITKELLDLYEDCRDGISKIFEKLRVSNSNNEEDEESEDEDEDNNDEDEDNNDEEEDNNDEDEEDTCMNNDQTTNMMVSSPIGPVVLTEEKKAVLNQGIGLILSRWTAMRKAVENGWGGSDSQVKAEHTVSSVFDYFIQSKDPLDFDGLVDILEAGLDELNTEADYGSLYEVTEPLLYLYEDCRDGIFKYFEKLKVTKSQTTASLVKTLDLLHLV